MTEPTPTPEAPMGENEDDTVVESEYAEGQTSEPDGAERDAPAGEDYAGSGF